MTGGEATVAGYDLRAQPEEVRRRIGWVGQTGGTDPRLSAREELLFQAQLYGASARQAAERAAELLEMVQLEEAADRSTGSCSGGQKRRLDIALGLVHRPRLLFLDEPTTGLDPQSRAHLWHAVRALRDGGVTVFLTTHYLEEADALCDRIAIIDHGRIVAEGTPADLKRQIGSDVISIRLASPTERVDAAVELLRSQPFVREIDMDDAQLRLYVEEGERAVPVVLRLLDGAGIGLLFAPLLNSIASVPGFPPGGAYNVFVPGLLVQLGLFGASSVGFGLIAEMRWGVIERMRVTPVSRIALLLGRALRDLLTLLVQAILIIALSVPFGLKIDVLSSLVMLGLVGLIGLATACISYALALALGDEDSFAPIVFTATLPLLLLSGVLLPLSLAPAWLRAIASINPLAYAVDAARAVFNNQLEDASVIRGLVIMLVLAIASITIAGRSFNRTVS